MSRRTKRLAKHEKRSKRASLFHQYFERVNNITKYGESRHGYGGSKKDLPYIVSKGTRETYLSAGKRFTKWLKRQQDCPKQLNEVTVDMVRRFFAETDNSSYTQHADRSALCKVLGFKPQQIPLQPRRKADITRSRGTTEQVARSAREAARNPVLRDFLLATGLRRTEAQRLRGEHIDLEAGTIYVARGKGGRSRIVPIRSDMLERVQELGLPEKGKVFGAIPKNFDVHAHRREYAQAVFSELSGGLNYHEAKEILPRRKLNRLCGEVAARLGHGRGRVRVVIDHYLT